MTKQLNQEEIDQILGLLKRNKVPYFDVQLEFVDHFASAIEANWETYPSNWTFEQKILSVYNEIGPKGFAQIMGDKNRILVKKANRFALNLLKDAIKIPQILITVSFIFSLHQSFLTFENPKKLFAVGLGIPMITLIILTISAYGFYWWRYKQRILTLEHSVGLYSLVPNLLMLPVYAIDKSSFPFSSEIYLLFSVMIFVQIIYCTGFLLVVRNIFKESRRRYAHLAKT